MVTAQLVAYGKEPELLEEGVEPRFLAVVDGIHGANVLGQLHTQGAPKKG